MNIDCCKSYVGKQIIGLAPKVSAQNCLWFNSAKDTACGSFSDPLWDFGGFGNDPGGYANSVGGYYVQDGDTTCFPLFTDTGSFIYFYYYGETAPPDLTYYDPNFNSTTTNPWANTGACKLGCLQTNLISPTNSPYDWLSLAFFPFGIANLSNYGGFVDFTSGANTVQGILNAMLVAYQPQASVAVEDAGGGFFRITYNDVYYNPAGLINSFQLIYDNGFDIDFFDLIEC